MWGRFLINSPNLWKCQDIESLSARVPFYDAWPLSILGKEIAIPKINWCANDSLEEEKETIWCIPYPAYPLNRKVGYRSNNWYNNALPRLKTFWSTAVIYWQFYSFWFLSACKHFAIAKLFKIRKVNYPHIIFILAFWFPLCCLHTQNMEAAKYIYCGMDIQ